MIELGVIYERLLMPMMTNAKLPTNIDAKFDILALFWQLLDSPSSVVSIYYNYDNHTDAWPIFQQVCQLLSDLVEGKSSGGAMVAPKTIVPPSEQKAEDKQTAQEENDAAEMAKKAALKLSDESLMLLTHIMQCLAERLEVPGIIPKFPLRVKSLMESEEPGGPRV
jgi:hypothetical protein